MKLGRRCVITGVGPVTPIGIGKEEFWKNLVAGKSNYSEIIRFELKPWDKVRIAAQIKDFNPELYVDNNIIEAINNLQARNGGLSIYYGVAAAKLAVKDSKLQISKEDREKIGVIVGSGTGDLGLLQTAKTDFTHGIYSLASALPSIISKELGIHGTNMAVSGACATGTIAVRLGYNEIKQGNYDIMIVGASGSPIDTPHYLGSEEYRKAGPKGLSQNNNLTKGMIPFDQQKDGVVLSEGAGVLILEELEHALKRKATIYAEVLGYGEYTDFDTNLIRITKKGYSRAIEKALVDANISKKELKDKKVYVNAHGTATSLNDSQESEAIYDVCKNKAYVSSFKGTIGHAQDAASGIELVGCALILKENIIPKTNLENISNDCAKLNYVKEAIKKPVDLIIKNSAGFGGIYSTIILGRYK